LSCGAHISDPMRTCKAFFEKNQKLSNVSTGCPYRSLRYPQQWLMKKGVTLSDHPFFDLVGTIGLEPTTPTMSRWSCEDARYTMANLTFVARVPRGIFFTPVNLQNRMLTY
ncbi:hypothetical protein, partial [Pseudomonas putida]|uniref:hypothetical protein n=1 Tax=Pseudomonas putida TaxID=303 RepID=UPI001F3E33CE